MELQAEQLLPMLTLLIGYVVRQLAGDLRRAMRARNLPTDSAEVAVFADEVIDDGYELANAMADDVVLHVQRMYGHAKGAVRKTEAMRIMRSALGQRGLDLAEEMVDDIVEFAVTRMHEAAESGIDELRVYAEQVVASIGVRGDIDFVGDDGEPSGERMKVEAERRIKAFADKFHFALDADILETVIEAAYDGWKAAA